MNDRQWQEAWDIFRAACQLSAEQRRAYLDTVRADPEILREVSSMLEDAAHDELPPPSKAGTRFGRYQIIEMLGSGGMGQVYSARDTELDRLVAVKFLSPEMASSRLAVERLVREAKAASALNHPHIVTVYEVSRSGDDVAIAMELVDGAALRSFCGKPVDVSKVMQWGRQIAQALAAAHHREIVHRDIKPENLMVRHDGILKVLDFGLARQSGGLGQSTNSLAMLAGTLNYMAPEQSGGEGATTASDVFSLGIVLFELSTGVHPFRASSPIDTAHAIAHAEPKRPSSLNPLIPPALHGLLMAMLQKNPAARPSAVEVDRRLSEIAVSTTRRRSWPAILAAAALATLVAAVWLFRSPEPISSRKDPVMKQLTTQLAENSVTASSISPDGKNLAFAALGGAVLVQRIGDGFTRPLSAPEGLRVDRIAWFADGSKLLLSGSLQGDEAIEHYRPDIWMMPLNGASAEKAIADGRDAVPSPDGAWIAYTSADQSAIWVSRANGGERRQLAEAGRTTTFSALIWSPNGKRIAFGRQDYAPKADRQAHFNFQLYWNYKYSYESVAVENGRVTAKTDGLVVASACGLPDGRVFFLRWISETMKNQIWEMHTDPGSGQILGTPQQVTHLRDMDVRSVSASNDGREVVATLDASGSTNIYAADLAVRGRVPRLRNTRRVTFSASGDYPHAWTPDNQAIIFESDRYGRNDLFRQRVDRREPEPLVVSKENKAMAQLTPDGEWLLFHQSAGQEGERKVMRVRPQGGTPEAVLPEASKVEFRCGLQRMARCVLRTVDKTQYVFYELDPMKGKGRELARTALTLSIIGDWDVSPDGSQVAIPIHEENRASIHLVKLDPRGGSTRVDSVTLKGVRDLNGVVWAADGQGLFVATKVEHGSILSYADLAGNVWDLRETAGPVFAVPSPDGQHIAFPERSTSTNAWLLRGL